MAAVTRFARTPAQEHRRALAILDIQPPERRARRSTTVYRTTAGAPKTVPILDLAPVRARATRGTPRREVLVLPSTDALRAMVDAARTAHKMGLARSTARATPDTRSMWMENHVLQ